MINKQRGIALIEVMVAFVILGVAALSLIKLQTYVEQKADFAQKSIEALHLAESQLEWFRQRGFSSPTYPYLLVNVHTDCNAMIKQPITRAIQLTCTALLFSSHSLAAIEIKAYWLDRLNVEQEVGLKTMLSAFSEFDI
ncbi:prepilin-type cleavage/methylation domain-containing protein [Vibrio sinensis]|uniref:Prepilin-type cleavage/methylation domain-containing protein n=1 Tax=Vibrio sinensis TaxID=2302434 RepID=A0A3A6QP93_9VIBR|nr:prepilin-type N-terminal cleavage/methylation domain-containing protein [Vibrio sinensis]RJX74263.1 prepilin-type cleavage/methylation domain-containing protein [Vibrio sinensis]